MTATTTNVHCPDCLDSGYRIIGMRADAENGPAYDDPIHGPICDCWTGDVMLDAEMAVEEMCPETCGSCGNETVERDDDTGFIQCLHCGAIYLPSLANLAVPDSWLGELGG